MRACPRCGSPNFDAARTCISCDAALPRPESPAPALDTTGERTTGDAVDNGNDSTTDVVARDTAADHAGADDAAADDAAANGAKTDDTPAEDAKGDDATAGEIAAGGTVIADAVVGKADAADAATSGATHGSSTSVIGKADARGPRRERSFALIGIVALGLSIGILLAVWKYVVPKPTPTVTSPSVAVTATPRQITQRTNPNPAKTPTPNPSPSPTPTASPSASPHPTITPTRPPPHVAKATFTGKWFGPANSQKLSEIDFLRGPTGLEVHVYGACPQNRCDFGLASLSGSGLNYVGALQNGVSRGQLTLSALSPDAERLHVHFRQQFTTIDYPDYAMDTEFGRSRAAAGAERVVQTVLPVATPEPTPQIVLRSTGAVRAGSSLSFDTGAESEADGDVRWARAKEGIRELSVLGSALIKNLGAFDYEGMLPDTLRDMSYGAESIVDATGEPRQLMAGDVFAVRTRNGNYAKVQVLKYGPALRLRWETYRIEKRGASQ